MFNIKLYKRIEIISILAIALIIGISSSIMALNKTNSLAQRVSNAISENYNQNFNISANSKGIIRIEGTVNSLYDKYNIFDIVSKIPGVKGIDDFVSINAPLLPSDVIKDGIKYNLKLDPSILEPNRIRVNVTDNGLVILSGTVSYPREKLQAETVASWEKGATGIVNLIKVLPKTKAESGKNIKTVVNDIIKNDFPLDNHVRLSVNNGIVTLAGHSSDIWGIDHLPVDCYKLEGVKKVVNDIKPLA